MNVVIYKPRSVGLTTMAMMACISSMPPLKQAPMESRWNPWEWRPGKGHWRGKKLKRHDYEKRVKDRRKSVRASRRRNRK